jgi:hypothetical protein
LSELKNALSTAYSKKDSELSILEINKQLEQDIVDISINAAKYE